MNCVIWNYKLKSNVCNIFSLVLVCAVLLFITGCTTDEKQKNTSKKVEYSEQGNKLTLILSNDKISIAENIELVLIAKAPAGSSITFEKLEKKFGDFVLTGPEDEETFHDPGSKFLQKSLTLEYEPEMTGEFKIPEFTVKYSNNNKTLEIKTKPINVVVGSQIADIKKAHLRDISGVIALKKDYFMWYVTGFIISIVLAVLICIFVIKILKKRARYRAICLPFFTALKSLQKLETSGSIEKGLNNIVCTGASDILRNYIEARFSIVASKCTTEEFLTKISDHSLLINNYSGMLKEFLEKCDVVKFAKYDASMEECHRVIQSCRLFVLQTKDEEISYNGEFGDIPGDQN